MDSMRACTHRERAVRFKNGDAFSHFACKSRGKLPLLLGQQKRRSTNGVVGVIERECGGEMSEQRGAMVACGGYIPRGKGAW
jgi:hypothetical protein